MDVKTLCSFLLAASALWLGLQPTAAQSCPMITAEEIEDVLSSYVADSTFTCGISSGTPSVSLQIVYINCLASGRLQDSYSYVTVTVSYGRSDRTGTQLSQLDIGCSENSNRWEASVLRNISTSASQVITCGSGLLNNVTLTDCSSCLSPQLAQDLGLVTAGASHCVGCNPVCQSTGLGLCYGLSTATSECCSYYDEGQCVAVCGVNKEPATDGSFECVCSDFRTGDNCTECTVVCENGGVPDTTTCNSCICPSGYTGALCDDDIDECLQDPCGPNGMCINTPGEYVCDCSPGFTGSQCEEELDECQSNLCKNFGTCVNQVNGFLCMCPDNLGGATCEECRVENCQLCNTSRLPISCQQCEQGYLPNGVGMCECTIENCVNCSGVTPMCTACNPGYQLRNGTCVCTVSNCDTCGTMGCERCAQGYALGFGNQCECTTLNCAECGPTGCERCMEGYALESRQCVCTLSNCISCQGSPPVCEGCEDGYTLSEEKCVRLAVGPNQCAVDFCTSCPLNANECTECEDDFEVNTANVCEYVGESKGLTESELTGIIVSAIIGGILVVAAALFIAMMVRHAHSRMKPHPHPVYSDPVQRYGAPNPFYSTVPPIMDNPTYHVENEDAENEDAESGSDEEPEEGSSVTEKSEAERA